MLKFAHKNRIAVGRDRMSAPGGSCVRPDRFLIRKVSRTIRSTPRLFTPCKTASSLLEAVAEATRNAASGNVVLPSPACAGLDLFRNHQHRGQAFCNTVKSIGRGGLAPTPHINGFAAPAGR